MRSEIPNLIIGSQPFLGESYQSETKNRLYRTKFSNVKATLRILKEAYGKGLDTISVMAMPGNPLFQKLLNALEMLRKEGLVFKVAPCISIPLKLGEMAVEDYRRWLTYYRYESKLTDPNRLRRKYLGDPILLTRSGWRTRFIRVLETGKPYGKEDFERLKVDIKTVEKKVEVFKGFRKPFINLGSESDFIAIAGRSDLLGETIEQLRSMGFKCILISSHHAGSTIPLIKEASLKIDGYVTPLNPIGALMLPTMESALKAVKEVKEGVVAIKPLAGGRVDPYRAFRFLAENGIRHCMIGVASLEELRADLEAASLIVKKRSKLSSFHPNWEDAEKRDPLPSFHRSL